MSDFPSVAAAFVGPPDMSRLSGGQRVLDSARSDIAMSLDSEIMQRKAVLDNAQSELANYITLTEANGKVAQQNAIQSLDRRINLTLGNAMQLADGHGITVPPPSEIRTRTSWPAPAILQSAPGRSPQPPIDGGGNEGSPLLRSDPAASGFTGLGASGTSEPFAGGVSPDLNAWRPTFPAESISATTSEPFTTIAPAPIVPFEPPPQQIQNVPTPTECPPTGQCPPCPPPPADPCQMQIWSKECRDGGQSACYILPAGVPPLSKKDRKIGGPVNDPQGKGVCSVWQQCDYNFQILCINGLPPPPIPPPICPPGQGLMQPQCPGLPPICAPPGQTPPPPCPPGFGFSINPGGGMVCIPIPPDTPPPPQCPPGQVPVLIGGEWICMSYSPPPPPSPTPTPAPTPTPTPAPTPSGPVNIYAPSITIAGGGSGTSPAINITPVDAAGPAGKMCFGWDQWAAQFKGQDPINVLVAEGVLSEKNLGLRVCDEAMKNAGDGIKGTLIWFVCTIISLPINAMVRAWAKAQGEVSDLACDNPSSMVAIGIKRMAITWLRRILGIDSRQADTVLMKEENYLCPVNTPGIGEANLARVRGDITLDEWRCWIRMANLHENFAEKVYVSERELLPPFELSRAWNRKYLNDKEYIAKLKERGVIKDKDIELTAKLAEFLPPVTDVLHFIVRGIGDPEIVKRFQLLEEFDTLYQGDLVKWGEAAGIQKKTMESYHAAHWIVPAPGQLFTMLQRLRQDNVPAGVDQKNWTVTKDDLNRALRENAYAPFWRPRLEAIAYSPLGIRQINKAFTEGAFTSKQVLPKLLDLGYSPKTAEDFLVSLQIQRRDYLRRHEIIKLYIAAAINKENAKSRLQQEGYEDVEIDNVIDWAGQEFIDKSRLKCVEGLKKRYECGEFDQGDVEQQLSEAGLDQDQIVTLRVRWDCERKSCGKQVAASQLCQWADSGLISSDEYFERLTNVGYTENDANNIVAECNLKQEAKVLAQRERAAKQAYAELQRAANRKNANDRRALSEARKAIRDLRQLQRQAASDEAKAARQASAATERANRIRAAMVRANASASQKIRVKEAMLTKAAEQWAAIAGLDLPSAARQVSQAVQAVGELSGTSADTTIRAVLLAVLAAKKAGTDDLAQAAVDLARAMQGYAAVATASVCEQTTEGCGSPQSNGSNAVPDSTNSRPFPGDNTSSAGK